MRTELQLKGVAKGALLGGLAAGVVNVALYFVGAALGADFKPRNPEAMGMAVLPPFQPMIICILAAVTSLGLLALLARVTPAKAWVIYLGAAVLVFLAEGYAPFWAFADLKTIAILELMHVPAALGIIGGIYRSGVVGPRAAPLAA